MELLSLAYDLRNLYGHRASIFGLPAQREVGERWPVEALRLVTDASRTITVRREDGTEETVRSAPVRSTSDNGAEATLEDVSIVDGVLCFSVHTTLRTGFAPADGTMAVRQSQEWGMFIPIDQSRAPLGMSSRSTIDSWGTVTVSGQALRSHLVGERAMRVRFTEVQ